jgi:hypothetical protein
MMIADYGLFMTENKIVADWLKDFETQNDLNIAASDLEERADDLIREQDRRIELLHGYLRFGYTLHNVKSLHELIDKALAATSPDAEWKG